VFSWLRPLEVPVLFRRLTSYAVSVIFAIITATVTVGQEADSLQPELLWSFELPADRAIRFNDHTKFKYPGSLAQAVPLADGVVLYDAITQKLVRLSSTGQRIWAVGEPGEGPEDHREPCEVRVAPGGDIAHVSLWPPAKVVYRGRDGTYHRSWPLPGLRDSQRVVFSGPWVFVLTALTDYEYDRHGEDVVEYQLTSIDPDGLPRDQQVVADAVSRRYRKGMVVKEEDLWPLPRIESGPAGRVLVQLDVFAPTVTIYAPDLTVSATITAPWTPPETSEAARQAMRDRTDGALELARTERALRHLFCYADREIWLQRPDTSRVVFATYDAAGKPLGEVELAGIEPLASLVLHDDLLLTFTEIAGEAPDDVTQQFAAYCLIRR
jgi:hypothetical protein